MNEDTGTPAAANALLLLHRGAARAVLAVQAAQVGDALAQAEAGGREELPALREALNLPSVSEVPENREVPQSETERL